MGAPELHRIADRLFAAFVDHDLDAVETMLAPDAVLTQNGTAMTFAEARPMLEAITATIGDHRYDNVRRVLGDDAIVEEHDVVATMPDGRPLTLAACVVVRVDPDGRITSLHEYVDPSPLR